MPDPLLQLEFAAAFIYTSIFAFLLTGFFRLKNGNSTHRAKISIVVAARNEEKHLGECLDSLLAQSYPKNLTEIIVVDDRSTDGTAHILKDAKAQNSNIKTITIERTPKHISPKKHALSQGIESAGGELIFTTDADCTPPEEWLSQTVPLFDDRTGLVIGPAPFQHQNGLLSKVLSLDNLATTFLSAGATGWNVGITCTGRNLAYRKSLFEELKGFSKINHSLSGDDDLFLQLVNKHTNWQIRYSLNSETSVPSAATDNFLQYITQRRRHVSASKYYSRPLQVAYFVYNVSNIYLFAFPIISFIYQEYIAIALIIFALKLSIDFNALFLITKKLKKPDLLPYFGLWQVFFLFNQTLISPLGFFGKIKWKQQF